MEERGEKREKRREKRRGKRRRGEEKRGGGRIREGKRGEDVPGELLETDGEEERQGDDDEHFAVRSAIRVSELIPSHTRIRIRGERRE